MFLKSLWMFLIFFPFSAFAGAPILLNGNGVEYMISNQGNFETFIRGPSPSMVVRANASTLRNEQYRAILGELLSTECTSTVCEEEMEQLSELYWNDSESAIQQVKDWMAQDPNSTSGLSCQGAVGPAGACATCGGSSGNGLSNLLVGAMCFSGSVLGYSSQKDSTGVSNYCTVCIRP